VHQSDDAALTGRLFPPTHRYFLVTALSAVRRMKNNTAQKAVSATNVFMMKSYLL
jgi:hypothetical protein